MDARSRGFNTLTEAITGMKYAAERTSRSMRKIMRTLERIGDTDGDRHVERIIKEILDGKPGRDPALRLECAYMLKEVIDGEYTR